MTKRMETNTCGCCAGVDSKTPVNFSNLPAQGMVSYRVGTHSKFKESMLAALAKAENPALLELGTRDDDDFTIACLDGVATMLDVLTFYQERYVNEHYLMTSTERRSVLEMAQLIGYQLSPGVAAATHLAFTLQTNPGDPGAGSDPVTIPQQTRVQSVPGQDEEPQIFETTADIEARAQWNAVPVQLTHSYAPEFGDLDLYVEGVGSNIKAGDAILIVGQDRKDNPGSERWDARIVNRVDVNKDKQRTRLSWKDPLGHINPKTYPAETNVSVFVFRKRTSLFGHNAPDPRLMSDSIGDPPINSDGTWDSYTIQNDEIDLANPEDNVVAGSWIVLVSNEAGLGSDDLPGYVELYRAEKVYAMSRLDFGISGKITRIEPDTNENIDEFDLQETLVLVDCEELVIHRRPVLQPVYGDTLSLGSHVQGLIPGQYLSITGRRQRLKVAPGVSLPLEGGGELHEGDSVQITATPEKLSGSTLMQLDPEGFGELVNESDSTTQIRLQLVDRDGSDLNVFSYGSNWTWDSDENDEPVSEIARIDDGENDVYNDRDRTILILTAALTNVYQRDSVQINFNVAPANNGETVTEILGDGDARKPDQAFVLKQSPLTYVSADTPSGAEAAMQLRVNEILWKETASLYKRNKDAREYQLLNRDDGTTVVRFGDGIEGGRLPTGQTNVRATYRKYVGAGANLDKGKLTTLLQKPLGVTEVINPEPSTGGADPEVIGDAKQNAPLTVLTLDRAVSVQDYRDYARAFSGVAKAHALWISSGPSRGIYITLSGIDGAHIPENSSTYINLLKSLRRYGDAMLPLSLVNYIPATFALGMAVKVNNDAVHETVTGELEATLRDYFSFANRDFGEHVSQDEVLAVAHSVKHVEAVRITRLYKNEPGATDIVTPIIESKLPIASQTVAPEAAELLTLSAGPMEMEPFS
jgi:hypothetical protein